MNKLMAGFAALILAAGVPAFSSALLWAAPAIAQQAPKGLTPGTINGFGPILNTLTPTLSWDPVKGVNAYYVRVETVPMRKDQTPTVAFQTLASAPPIAVPAGKLEPGKVYIWRVEYPAPGNLARIRSDEYFFQTAAPPPPPYQPPPRLAIRAANPGSATEPGPMLASREVTFEWDVEHPEFANRFELDLGQGSPRGPCWQGIAGKLPAKPNQKRYSLRTWLADHCLRNASYSWTVIAYDAAGKMVGISEPLSMFFQLPQVPKVVMKEIGPGTRSAPGPMVASRDITLEWTVDHPEAVTYFWGQLQQLSADGRRSCAAGDIRVPATPGQPRYSFRLTARDTRAQGCDSDRYGWTITAQPQSPDTDLIARTDVLYFQVPSTQAPPTSTPAAPLATALSENFVLTFGGQAAAGISGGRPPYAVRSENPAIATANVEPGGSGVSLISKAKGTVRVIITDSRGQQLVRTIVVR